jgi:hypothetical protein
VIVSLLALALQAATPFTGGASTGLPLGEIGPQALPTTGCAAFFWSVGPEHKLVAMATAQPAQVRLSIDGKTADFALAGQRGDGGFGFSGVTDYAGGDVSVIIDMTIVTRGDLANGAQITAATLRFDRLGRDTVVMPVAGMIGCK